MHKVLEHKNYTDNQVKTECFIHPVAQKSILKIIKLAKIANFSPESGSESGSNFIGPLQEREYYTNINFHEILLKTYCLKNF